MKCPRCKKEVKTMSVLTGVCDDCVTPEDDKKRKDFMKDVNNILNDVI